MVVQVVSEGARGKTSETEGGGSRGVVGEQVSFSKMATQILHATDNLHT